MAFDGAEQVQARPFEAGDPAFLDLLDGNGIEVVQTLASLAYDGDQIRLGQEVEVLSDRLAGHGQVLAEFAQ